MYESVDRVLRIRIIRKRSANCNPACALCHNPIVDELPSINEKPCTDTFFEARSFKVANFLSQFCQGHRRIHVDASFVGNDLRLLVARRIVKVDGDKALPCRMFEILENALVTRVVGDYEKEVGVRFDTFALLVDRQDSAVIG